MPRVIALCRNRSHRRAGDGDHTLGAAIAPRPLTKRSLREPTEVAVKIAYVSRENRRSTTERDTVDCARAIDGCERAEWTNDLPRPRLVTREEEHIAVAGARRNDLSQIDVEVDESGEVGRRLV